MQKSNNNVFRQLWPYIWTQQPALQKFKFVVFLAATLVTTLLIVSIPLLLKYVMMVLDSKEPFLGFTPILIVILYGLTWMFAKIIDRLRHQASMPMMTNIIHKLCSDVFSHLQHLSMRFHDDKRSGKIFNTVFRTRDALANFLQATAQELMPILIQILLASLLLTFYFGFHYGAVLLVMLMLYIVLSVKSAEAIVRCRQKQNETDGAANAYIVDSLLNAETAKYFGMANYEADRAQELLIERQEADIASLMSDAKVHLLQNAIIGLAVFILTFMSGFAVFQGHLHVSDFVMINAFVLILMAPLSTLGYRYRQAKLQLAQLESTFELLQEPIEIKDHENAKPLQFNSGEVTFKDVTFGYSKERTILKNLSFTVRPGTTTAIVGESGSGKSTIAKLLFRLYDVGNGSINIDKQDVKRITKQSLCVTVGMVPQDTILFNDTLEHNIVYANESSQVTNLDSTLVTVDMKHFVDSLPLGLETVVGERGLKLSGGERQRLAIARMLVRQPKIMVFDEATSALDLNTEKKVQECLLQISKGVTTIIIAHRLSTIQHADNIIVLDEGHIAEQGSHQELLQKEGLYSRLLEKQKREV